MSATPPHPRYKAVELEDSEDAHDNGYSRRQTWSSSRTDVSLLKGLGKWHLANIGLHVHLVLLHFILVAIMARHAERRVLVAIGKETTSWTLVLQISLQAASIIYLALLLFVVQKVFLQRLLNRRQSLTASHDQYGSWMGLGAAMNALWKQRLAVSGPMVLFIITTYLVASAALKITTPALFAFVPFNTTISSPMNSTSQISSTVRNLGYTGTDVYPDTAVFLDLLARDALRNQTFMPPTELLGKADNVLYDLLPRQPNGANNITVASYTAQVSCGTYDPTQWKLSDIGLFNYSTQMSLLTCRGGPDGPVHTYDVPRPWVLPVFSLLNISDSDGKVEGSYPMGNTTAKITPDFFQVYFPQSMTEPDTANLTALGDTFKIKNLQLSVNNPDTSPDDPSAFSFPLVNAQFLVCSITWNQSSIILDTSSMTSLNLSNPRKRSSHWTKFKPEGYFNGSVYHMTNMGVFLNSRGVDADPFNFEVGEHGPPSQGVADTVVLTEGKATNLAQRIDSSEKYIRSKLGIFEEPQPPKPGEGLPSIALHDLENTLEDYIAMYTFSFNKARFFVPDVVEKQKVLVQVPLYELKSQLRLNPIPVYVGLCASLVLLFVGSWISWTTSRTQGHVLDGLGLLQILWLTYVVESPRPTESGLRTAETINLFGAEISGLEEKWKI
ncbi:hypothetical protein DL96DRAFT_1710371 [Flagelloscypha sp. PMI_526]|nr:hypothetical protein DL96DRAFT_1710371 [Flagelloscypha sp. PMI_526]